jgi:TRAP-type mannitol/chloroaromatic compound transport system permease small subunit
MIQIFLRSIDALCRVSAWLAAITLALMGLLGMVEILSRWWFNYSLQFAFEYSAYMLAFILFGGSAWALGQGAHIRVNLIMQPLGAGARRVVDLIGTTFALGISSYLSIASVQFTARTYALGSVSYFPSETPLAWPQTAFTFGLCLLSLALLARLIRLVIGEEAEVSADKKNLEETAL